MATLETQVFCPRCGSTDVTIICCGNVPLGLVTCRECENVFTTTSEGVHDILERHGMIERDDEDGE